MGSRGRGHGLPVPYSQQRRGGRAEPSRGLGRRDGQVLLNPGVVDQNGDFSLIRLPQEIKFPYGQFDATPQQVDRENLLAQFIQSIVSPARLAGQVLLVLEPVDYRDTQRQAWVYNPGQRRVRRAPNVEHDNPGTASDGLRTNDQNGVFNGSLERYNWELVGKKEVYIPYNSYRIDQRGIPYDEIIQPGHINQELARYELHRVWVVDATVREGTSHIYARRTFYIDEDSWKMALVDVYDRRGNLWRFQEGHLKNYYHVPLVTTAFETVYDLQSGRYLTAVMDNNDPPKDWTYTAPDSHFTPAALRRTGVR